MPGLTIRRTLDLDCSPADLWRLVTDPNSLSGWLGREVEIDARSGGQGRVLDDDGIIRLLVVDEVVPGERLSFTWWPQADDAAASEVTFTVQEADEGSRLVVTETASAVVADGGSWDTRLISLWLAVCSQVTV